MTDIDTLLRAADPAAGVPDYSDAECRHILVRAIAPTTPPKRRAGWRIGAVASAMVMVTAVGVSNLVGTGLAGMSRATTPHLAARRWARTGSGPCPRAPTPWSTAGVGRAPRSSLRSRAT